MDCSIKSSSEVDAFIANLVTARVTFGICPAPSGEYLLNELGLRAGEATGIGYPASAGNGPGIRPCNLDNAVPLLAARHLGSWPAESRSSSAAGMGAEDRCPACW